mmetsp:Transcript_28427/g.73167  ORF Transcript_28427/g.73167 Transcript_28427/m.73167 type:complete len:201 (+) Transcript_28427:455-1057(+)
MHALVGLLTHLIALVPQHLGRVDHVVERPVLLGVLAAHLLPVGGQEALRVEEARQPEAVGPAVLEPARQLLGAQQDVAEPHAHRRRHKVGHLGPERRHAREEERVDRVRQVGAHHNRAGNRQLEVGERRAQHRDDLLQPVDLLPQADVERLLPAERLDARLDVVAAVVRRQLRLERLDLAQHDVLARLARAAARVLWRDV